MIDDLRLKIFILVYWSVIGLGIDIDVKYYSQHFKGTKNGRKDGFK